MSSWPLFHQFKYLMDTGIPPKIGTMSHCFFGNSSMGAFTVHRQSKSEGCQG